MLSVSHGGVSSRAGRGAGRRGEDTEVSLAFPLFTVDPVVSSEAAHVEISSSSKGSAGSDRATLSTAVSVDVAAVRKGLSKASLIRRTLT
jgi:hypothetical protein